MRCAEFAARFDELLDERREPLDEPELADHAAACAGCRRTAASIGAAIGALAELHVPLCGASTSSAESSSSNLSVDRILEAIRRDAACAVGPAGDSARPGPGSISLTADMSKPATSSLNTSSLNSSMAAAAGARGSVSQLWRGSAFYALIATAATILLAAYPVWRWNAAPPAGNPIGGQIAATGPSATNPHATGLQVTGPQVTGPQVIGPQVIGPQVPGSQAPGVAVDPETLPSFTELARESRDSYEQLARDTRRSLDDALALASVFSSEAAPHTAPGAEPDGWLNQVEDGLEPLKRSTLGTLDVLRQVVPADTETRS
jgi:hypothetical protein